MEIEKGAPRDGTGAPLTEPGLKMRALAEAAFADKGEWYSIPQSSTITNQHTLAYAAVSKVAARVSTKQGRVWIRFHKDSDEPE